MGIRRWDIVRVAGLSWALVGVLMLGSATYALVGAQSTSALIGVLVLSALGVLFIALGWGIGRRRRRGLAVDGLVSIRRLMLAVLLLGLVTACTQTAASPTEEPTPTPTEEPTPTRTEEPPQEATEDLASVLPDEIGGITLEYEFASGEQAIGSGGMTPAARAFLEGVGADVSSVDAAFGSGYDPEGMSGIGISAVRVEGADEDRLRDEYRAMLEEGGSGALLEEATIAGKDVLVFAVDTALASTNLMYVKGDTVFLVGGTTPELMEEAVAALP